MKKVCLLGCPTYGEFTAAAARGFFRPTRGGLEVTEKQVRPDELDVSLLCQQSSLLAANCNVLWCWALNEVHAGGQVDYFAMIHSDIEPMDAWLDHLVAEIDRTGLDVLGVAAPIKDQRGVTSIAMARPDGDNWKVHGRLTMAEIHRLPETFTSEDLGFDLLINTGCWVCKWNQEWARRVHFTINDRIVFDPKARDGKGLYFSQVEPEDWFISRLFHEQGLKIGCTRKIELGHRGPMSFGNTEPWGRQQWDQEYLPKSVLDDRSAHDWFPFDAAGWLTTTEGQELARLGEGKAILEIGSYCGRSTICLAQRAISVAAIDTFDGRGTAVPGQTFETFQRNLRRYGVHDKVSPLVGPSEAILPNLPPVFDLAFIDGSHDRDSVKRDAELALRCLRERGRLVFHDYQTPENPGVTAAVDEMLAAGARLIGRCESLAIVEPAEEVNSVAA